MNPSCVRRILVGQRHIHFDAFAMYLHVALDQIGMVAPRPRARLTRAVRPALRCLAMTSRRFLPPSVID
jgi:hypothetical protein